MYFYLLNNSSLIKEENKEVKNIKIFIYGTITYVLTHAIFFIGGSDSLLHPLKSYFWIIFLLDCIVIYTIYQKLNKGSSPFDMLIKMLNITNIKKENKNLHDASESKTRVPIITNSIPSPSELKMENIQKTSESEKIEKKVNFKSIDYSENESDSDFSSDIDIDMDMFKKSL